MRPTAVILNRHTLGRWLIAGLLAAMVLVTVASAAEYNPVRTRPKSSVPATVQRVIVKFRQVSRLSTQATPSGESASTAAVDASRMSALASRARITVHSSRAIGVNMHVMHVSPLTSNETAAETLARLQADSDVEFAVLDRRVYASATSNDPLAPVTGPGLGQWYLTNTQPSAINANAAWDITKGSNGVVIAVVDTGVLFDHPDLQRASSGGRFLPGYDFVEPDSSNVFNTANDGDGRDSDASDPGDWVSAADTARDSDCSPTEDSSWHGTRVSGIIGALTNNGVGVAGINWNGFILPVRVLGKCGGFNSDVIAGIGWAAGFTVPGVPANPNPAQIINISLGGTGACDPGSQDIINQVTAAGVLVVVAAGNEGGPVDSPANCTGAMGIVGLRHAGTKVGFSSLGPQIALAAPGGNCVNTAAGQPCLFSLDTTSNLGTTVPGTNTYTDQFNTNLGTSFSTPIVSGIAGLMLSVNGNLKSAQLIKRMQDGSTKPFPTTSDTGTPPVCHVPVGASDVQPVECSCTTQTCGAGMANANLAVIEALRPIAAISAPVGFSGGQSLSLLGAGSAAACGRTIPGTGYSWTVISGTAVPTPANTANTSIVAPTSGSTVVRLTVTDDQGKTDSADLTVTATTASTSAPASAGNKACLTDIAAATNVTIAATDANAAEAGLDPGVFTITRTGSTVAALAVNLSIGGTATNGTDYQTIASSVTIPAGSASATVTVTPIDDTVVDAAETVIATIQPGAYAVGTASSATVTIADNDVASTTPPPATTPPAAAKKGGGGAFDPLTLFAGLAFAAYAALRRRVAPRCPAPI